MFANREQAARMLADELRDRALTDPLVLAIPRGGVVTGAVLARELGAELDVVLARKVRAPYQPELAVGAITEDGNLYLDPATTRFAEITPEYLAEECRHQLDEIARRKARIRSVRPQAAIRGRSVIVTDDGIATGSTMIAALRVAREQGPHELIVAVPVAPPDRLAEVRDHCDEAVCLLAAADFWAIGQFYEDFTPVDDAEVVALLQAVNEAHRIRVHQ